MRMTLAVAALLLAGCPPAHLKREDASMVGQAPLIWIDVDVTSRYLIDPRSETCTLLVGASVVVPVDCQKLKKNLPEAARYITWEPGPAAADPSL
jgi:hypothetical protein